MTRSHTIGLKTSDCEARTHILKNPTAAVFIHPTNVQTLDFIYPELIHPHIGAHTEQYLYSVC